MVRDFWNVSYIFWHMLLLWFIEWLFNGSFKRLFWSGNSRCSVLQRAAAEASDQYEKSSFPWHCNIYDFIIYLYISYIVLSPKFVLLSGCVLWFFFPFSWDISYWNPPVQAIAHFPSFPLSPFDFSYSVKANGKQHFPDRSTFAILIAYNGHIHKITAVGDQNGFAGEYSDSKTHYTRK